jgi:hypothetical protein
MAKFKFRNNADVQFYADCAIAAMQGIQEGGTKLEGMSAILLPKKLAEVSFRIADAMLDEYQRKTDFGTEPK